MTVYIRTRKENKMQLNENILTGDTYPIKDYIKNKLSGKWDGNSKTWTVDLTLVQKWLDKGGTIYTDKDVSAQPVATQTPKWYFINSEGQRELSDDC